MLFKENLDPASPSRLFLHHQHTSRVTLNVWRSYWIIISISIFFSRYPFRCTAIWFLRAEANQMTFTRTAVADWHLCRIHKFHPLEIKCLIKNIFWPAVLLQQRGCLHPGANPTLLFCPPALQSPWTWNRMSILSYLNLVVGLTGPLPNVSHAWSIIGSDMPSALGLVQTVVGGIQYMVIVSFTLFELEYWMYTNRKKKTLPWEANRGKSGWKHKRSENREYKIICLLFCWYVPWKLNDAHVNFRMFPVLRWFDFLYHDFHRSTSQTE